MNPITTQISSNYLFYSIQLQIQQLKLTTPLPQCNIEFEWIIHISYIDNNENHISNNNKDIKNIIQVKKCKIRTKCQNNVVMKKNDDHGILMNFNFLQDKLKIIVKKQQPIQTPNFKTKKYQISAVSINKSYLNNQFYNTQNESFIKIILEKQGKRKLAGIVRFNLIKSINDPYGSGLAYYHAKLEQCPDENAKLMFGVKYNFYKQISNAVVKKQDCDFNSSCMSPRGHDRDRDNFNVKSPASRQRSPIFKDMSLTQNFTNQKSQQKHQIELIKIQYQNMIIEYEKYRKENSEKLMKIINELNQSQNEKQGLIKEIQNYKFRLQLFNKNYNEEVQMTKQKNAKLSAQNEQSKNQIFRLQNHLLTLQTQFETAFQHPIKQLQNQVQKLSQDNYVFKNQNSQLYIQINKMTEKNQVLERKMKEKQIQCQLIREKYQKLEKEKVKEKGFTQQAYYIMQEKYEESVRLLNQKSHEYSILTEKYNQVENEKMKQMQLLRRKFDSLRVKLDQYQEQRRLYLDRVN